MASHAEALADQRAHALGTGHARAPPVAALALPLESTTAAARPDVAARWARLTCTGAAAARLAVNTPAAGTGTRRRGHQGQVGGAGRLDPARQSRRPRTPSAR